MSQRDRQQEDREEENHNTRNISMDAHSAESGVFA
jgi:hypothetical protein